MNRRHPRRRARAIVLAIATLAAAGPACRERDRRDPDKPPEATQVGQATDSTHAEPATERDRLAGELAAPLLVHGEFTRASATGAGEATLLFEGPRCDELPLQIIVAQPGALARLEAAGFDRLACAGAGARARFELGPLFRQRSAERAQQQLQATHAGARVVAAGADNDVLRVSAAGCDAELLSALVTSMRDQLVRRGFVRAACADGVSLPLAHGD